MEVQHLCCAFRRDIVNNGESSGYICIVACAWMDKPKLHGQLIIVGIAQAHPNYCHYFCLYSVVVAQGDSNRIVAYLRLQP